MYQSEIEHLNERIAALGERVAQLEEEVQFLMSHTHAPYVRTTPEERQANLAAVIELVKKGKTMEAIKLYREKHPSTLQDAQKAVEELRSKYAA